MKARVGSLVALAAFVMGISVPAAAYVRGAVGRPANVQSARTGVANRNVNVNQNVNVNRNVNVNDNRGYGYRGGGCCYDHWGHPVAVAVAVTATAVAVGTIAASLPASGCSGVSVGGASYQKCGPNYYQPIVQNGTTQYVVVNAP